MSGFLLQSTGIASAVFVAVYAIYLVFACWLLYLRGFKTIFTFLFVFALIRLGGQISGIIFSMDGYNDLGALIAYMVLTAQGFIALLFATLRATIYEQKHAFGHSWFYSTHLKNSKLKILQSFSSPYAVLAWILSSGSIISIVVGVEQSDSYDSLSDYDHVQHLRIAALCIFLFVTVALVAFSWYVYLIEKIQTRPLVFILISGVFLLIRVIYNLLAVVVSSLGQYTYSVAAGVGVNPHFIVYDAILGMTTEFICCLLLTVAFVYSHSPTRSRQESQSDSEKEHMVSKNKNESSYIAEADV